MPVHPVHRRNPTNRAGNEAGALLASLTLSSPRELRRLPGIGQARALAIARARWQHDPMLGPLRLTDVHGIGQRIASRVRAALDRQVLPPSTGARGR